MKRSRLLHRSANCVGRFGNAIQNKDSATFWSLLFGVFCFLAAIAVASSLAEYYIEAVLKIRWRRWRTERWRRRESG